MRARSMASNANKAENIMDVSPAEVAKVMATQDATRLIHGHTHRPGIHQHPWGRRYVLGAWERCGWAIMENPLGELRLLCFPLAGRCEI
jgi:UDP-2,3-diacylglucosamine hydrolase